VRRSEKEHRKVNTRTVSTGVLAAATALAHYTWVAPVDFPLQVGKTSVVRINHGHKFPHSEEAIGARQVEFFVLAPSGARVKLEPVVSRAAMTANYAVKEGGLHRIVMIQDRGVMSRTPKGLQPGGRDKHPDAAQAYRMLRSAVSYANTSKPATVSGKAVGLAFELVGAYSNGTWQLQLVKDGRAVPEVAVEAFLGPHPVSLGKTGPDGRLAYKVPDGAKGPAMFTAELREPSPAGATYDAVNYSTSLYVSW
jgi:hypothetical protein